MNGAREKKSPQSKSGLHEARPFRMETRLPAGGLPPSSSPPALLVTMVTLASMVTSAHGFLEGAFPKPRHPGTFPVVTFGLLPTASWRIRLVMLLHSSRAGAETPFSILDTLVPLSSPLLSHPHPDKYTSALPQHLHSLPKPPR